LSFIRIPPEKMHNDLHTIRIIIYVKIGETHHPILWQPWAKWDYISYTSVCSAMRYVKIAARTRYAKFKAFSTLWSGFIKSWYVNKL